MEQLWNNFVLKRITKEVWVIEDIKVYYAKAKVGLTL